MRSRFALVAVVLTAGLRPPLAGGEPVDFDQQVRPILTAHCVSCHGAEKQKGGLRLDEKAAAFEGGNSGPVIVPGKAADSRLIRAVSGADPEAKMPPGDESLSAAEVATLRAWIDQGAKWGAAAGGGRESAVAKSTHWAFQPVRRPAVPAGVHPIDHFVRARLAREGLAPSPEADRRTLARRLYLDLIGLPPDPKEVDEFVADASPGAYEKLVDKLLASPHYGERWGRHWLDLARYADSDGYEKDTGRPFAWRFRDWVIAALNRDLPFDQFTVEQLAGDLLPNATVEQKIATGFHRNTLTNREGGVDPEEFRVAAVVDRVTTTGTVWLGLTVGCCQCHDHKYDPLSQREFYRLFAFFNSDREVDLPAPLPGEAEKLKERQAAFDVKKAELQKAVEEAKAKQLPAAEVRKREKAVADHAKAAPAATRAQTLALGPARPTHVLIRGDFLRRGVAVEPGVPAVLPPLESPPPAGGGLSPPNRLDLARWLVSPENPLTPRVTVNWVWSKFFGRGLVATPEDFGTQGQRPSHPELLDWLAAEFVAPGKPRDDRPWALKRLHKLIVTSATYRQAAAVRPGLRDRDPLNALLARQARLRLEGEVVRDAALAASGLLTRTVGGPSVRPPQPPGVSELTYAGSAKWVESTGPDRYRRGLYTWFQRTSPYPMLTTFDGPDGNVCAARRERSNTPLQALTLLNDAVFVEAAQALAKRVQAERKNQPACVKADHLFALCVGRPPEPGERDRLLALHKELRALAAAKPAEAAKLVGKEPPAGVPAAEAAAWVGVARAVLNLDEFVTRE